MKDNNVLSTNNIFSLPNKGKKRSRSPVIYNKKNKKNKVNEDNKDKYDEDGYDEDGYDKDGYDRDGFNKDGFNEDGYDKDGYDEDGYDKDGYDEDGYNEDGLDKNGFDKNGFNEDGFDKDGYDEDGYDKDGFDKDGYDISGFNSDGFDKDGYDVTGYDKKGYDKYDYDVDGYDRKGYDIYGFDKDGYDENGFDKDGYDENGFDSYGFDKDGYDKYGFDIDGFDRTGYDRYGYDKDGYDENGYDMYDPASYEDERENENEDEENYNKNTDPKNKDEDKKPKFSLILLLDALANGNDSGSLIPPLGVSGKKIKLKMNKNKKSKKKIKKPESPKKPSVPKKYVRIQREINDIEDLIELGKLYDPIKAETEEYNIDLYRLNELVEPLTELKNMIGLNDAKKYLVNQIVYYLQDFEENNLDMMHTVIEGSPGVGKTTFAKILSKIFLKMGILENDKFITARRSDLIGGYLGQTAMKTQDVIDSADGGVLFIDEVYSLGHPEKRDSFSKECIDVLNQNLTENKGNFICIIAGYKDDNKRNFFAMNPGLERRFPWRISMSDYDSEELREIFIKMVLDKEWDVDGIDVDFFEKNKCYFKFNGGDMETLFQMCRIVHSRRVFCLDLEHKKKLTMTDLENGLEMFLGNEEIKKRKDELDEAMVKGLYI